MRNKFWLALALIATVALPATAQKPAEKSEAPHGLSDVQWNHVLKNNEGRADELKVGEIAPDFELPSYDGESTTKLSSFRDERPVILFFGSYT